MCLKKTNKTEQAKVLDYFIITKGMIKEMKDNTFAVDLDYYFNRLAKCLGDNFLCLEGNIVPKKLDRLNDIIEIIRGIEPIKEPQVSDIFDLVKIDDDVLPICYFNDFYRKACLLETTEEDKQQYIKIVDDFEFFLSRYIQAGGIVIIDYIADKIIDCESLKNEIDHLKNEIKK